MDTPTNDQAIQFAPIPASFEFAPASANGMPIVIMTIRTPDTMNVTFWPPEAITAMCLNAQKAATQAKSGLIIPGANGGGVTDLASFRDQPEANVAEETDTPSAPE